MSRVSFETATDFTMTPLQSRALIFGLFETFTDFDRPVEDMTAFLTADYRQVVDGKTLDLGGFLDHARALRSALTKLDIDIERFVTDGAAAATVHTAHAVRTSGEATRVKVVAYYVFRDRRLAMVDELTRPVTGDRHGELLGAIGTKDAT